MEKLLRGIGGEREKCSVKPYTDAFLTISHAESSLQLDFILHMVFFNQALQSFQYLMRSPYMAGAS